MNINKKIEIPGIGMRIVKSAVAVAICYLIDAFRDGHGMVFYSQLAALWCIQMYRVNTKKNAIQRITGTVIGAIYGLILLLIKQFCYQNAVSNKYIFELIISAMIVLVLYTTVLLNRKQASYFSCVVFLSIVVNHIGDANPYLFVFNRFLDTMLGIIIGIAVNDIKISFHRNRNTLFISGVDGLLLDDRNNLSSFSKVELNRLIDDGMQFTLSTMRTPASIMESMQDVRLKLPIIVMNGAALYDPKDNSYIKVYVISKETSQKLVKLINDSGINYYSNVIIDDMLVIYYKETDDEINSELVRKLRTSPYRNYINRPLPDDELVVYFMLLDKTEKINSFYEQLQGEELTDKLRVIKYESSDFKGYSYIKNYNKNAIKENMIEYLSELISDNDVVTFGTIKDQYDVFIDTNDVNRVVREVRKRYEPFLRRNGGYYEQN